MIKIAFILFALSALLLSTGCSGDIKFDQTTDGKVIPTGNNSGDTTGNEDGTNTDLVDEEGNPLTSEVCVEDGSSLDDDGLSDDGLSDDGCSADDGTSTDS